VPIADIRRDAMIAGEKRKKLFVFPAPPAPGGKSA
jgi:hypothetical protein